ncbi:MAG: ADP-forming succinate--CoA ligase subunit beta [Rhodobiaceae bacterium]|nr:ADP-forming succinate--CoA ligase subunit beta [Rhodobiaceae bacterium]RPF97433.1 MAG: ADP-forming succinate--CoA ligase subunit beta [Rhizobiales bacterium TMED227]|tara:strand:- start:698 stop:1870 length:1173 start_codon:yes stop_codon:yes gene_type:complete
MNIHEHQAKELLKQFNVPVLNGFVAYNQNELDKQIDTLKGPIWVVKAQIHAGGRGKGGGVKVVNSKENVYETFNNMMGMNLVTKQTGPEGKEVKRIYIEDGCMIKEEFYISYLIDRKTKSICLIASSEGGMDIEEVAEKTPLKIAKIFIDPVTNKLSKDDVSKVSDILSLGETQFDQLNEILSNILKLFIEKDASLIEINPFVLTEDNQFLCLDAKMNFDSNALFRHEEILSLRDLSEEEPLEIEASKHGLNYIKLDGTIGCMVNGAGLAMATMDIIKLYGEKPANFLDVGGGATKEQVMNAFKIILSDESVKGILVNIFGGIMRCEIIAQGIIDTANELNLSIPLVVRLEGTNVELGKKYLDESGLNIISANDLDEAAKKIVSAVSKGN